MAKGGGELHHLSWPQAGDCLCGLPEGPHWSWAGFSCRGCLSRPSSEEAGLSDSQAYNFNNIMKRQTRGGPCGGSVSIFLWSNGILLYGNNNQEILTRAFAMVPLSGQSNQANLIWPATVPLSCVAIFTWFTHETPLCSEHGPSCRVRPGWEVQLMEVQPSAPLPPGTGTWKQILPVVSLILDKLISYILKKTLPSWHFLL